VRRKKNHVEGDVGKKLRRARPNQCGCNGARQQCAEGKMTKIQVIQLLQGKIKRSEKSTESEYT
jgi:hypothetical protein